MNITPYIAQSSFDATRDMDSRNSFNEEKSTVNSTHEMKPVADSEGEPVSLEGYLLYRMGRSSGQSMLIWRRRFVYFSFADGGSITVYKESPNFNVNRMDHDDDDNKPGKGMFRSVYKKLSVNFGVSKRQLGANNVDFDITHDLPWMAKDVVSDSATFVIEVSTTQNLIGSTTDMSFTTSSRKSSDSNSILEDDDDVEIELDAMGDSVIGDDVLLQADSFENGKMDYDNGEDPDVLNPLHLVVQPNLTREISYARSKKKPLRIYFRCEKGSNEKALWLRAFSTFGRLSTEFRRHKGLISTISQPLSLASSRVRIRNRENATLARDTRNLDLSASQKVQLDLEMSSVEKLALGTSAVNATDKEYKVVPAYAYPHRWMTLSEMRQEMILPSEHMHDLRVPGCQEKEIGELKVEVLQCLGLPKLDRVSDTDAVVYLVCGAYSFVTDVVPNRQNPMWLRKARRACNFPIFHAYSSLYVGVFDHETKRTKDDFAGRIEIKLSRLRPGSVYDVMLPLRVSTQVYSRRKRGAIRLRFSIRWTTERDALLSYIPRRPRIPLPQNTTPNYDVSVHCTDPKAFRNIAITVHGAHLPGRFTFVQMRAAIREINYTRKFLFTAMRQSFKHLRQWQSPSLSAYAFISWMHCIYSNQFALVPAYAVLFFLILLMCNYVRYSTDEPSQRGFVPPSWEEMLMALVRGTEEDYTAIKPLELFPVKPSTSKRRKLSQYDSDKRKEYKAITHVPMGKRLLRGLGLVPLKSRNAEDDHLEFPFSNGAEYPKFRLKECLVHRNKESDLSVDEDLENADGMRERSLSGDSQFNSTNPLSRFAIDMELPERMRRDCSGLREFDEEEMNFNATKVVLATGKHATSTFTKTASALGDKTGINSFVVNPLQAGIQTGLDVGVSRVNYLSTHVSHVAQSTRNLVSGHGNTTAVPRRTLLLNSGRLDSVHDLSDDGAGNTSALHVDTDAAWHSGGSVDDSVLNKVENEPSEIDPALLFPEQDIDVEGPQSAKKLTDDLAEVKDKMHELTWHLFDDHPYIVKNTNTVFFGDSKKSEKRRKSDVNKELDRFLGLGKYSYSNPFVSRVGLYVEPIIGSAYSFLCLFRAGFNVITWRDPMFTFWVSLFCGVLVIVLFVFPWRLFLFVVGVLLVGPQNWLIRILRERGHLPPEIGYRPSNKMLHMFTEEIKEIPAHVPIITAADRKPGNEPRSSKAILDDPREIHHVVIPNSPLIYQRCYDWPPEPKYSTVRPDTIEEDRPLRASRWDAASTMSSGATKTTEMNSTTDAASTVQRRQQIGIRNRFNRKYLHSDGDIISSEIQIPSTAIHKGTLTQCSSE